MRFLSIVVPFLVFIITSFSFSINSWAKKTNDVWARPPQFVMLAFDNCEENSTWKEVSEFLTDMNAVNQDRLRFTFFLSGAALVRNDRAVSYQNPANLLREPKSVQVDPSKSKFIERATALENGKDFQDKGMSNIGFGGESNDLIERALFLNDLVSKGNEISSHAVGHFRGGKWSDKMWKQELLQFRFIVDHFTRVNDLPISKRLQFTSKDIVGFRAPYLESNDALLETLKKFNYAYDTSDTKQGFESNTWPQKYDRGFWNFGLGFITIPGIVNETGGPQKVAAMDYTICSRQDKGCKEIYPDTLVNADRDAENTLHGYMDYFLQNYNGNRAPVHIGHHFHPYRGGAYNRALFRFARVVCALPEVRCTTYKELTKFMDSLPKKSMNALQEAQFEKASYQPTLEELVNLAR